MKTSLIYVLVIVTEIVKSQWQSRQPSSFQQSWLTHPPQTQQSQWNNPAQYWNNPHQPWGANIRQPNMWQVPAMQVTTTMTVPTTAEPPDAPPTKVVVVQAPQPSNPWQNTGWSPQGNPLQNPWGQPSGPNSHTPTWGQPPHQPGWVQMGQNQMQPQPSWGNQRLQQSQWSQTRLHQQPSWGTQTQPAWNQHGNPPSHQPWGQNTQQRHAQQHSSWSQQPNNVPLGSQSSSGSHGQASSNQSPQGQWAQQSHNQQPRHSQQPSQHQQQSQHQQPTHHQQPSHRQQQSHHQQPSHHNSQQQSNRRSQTQQHQSRQHHNTHRHTQEHHEAHYHDDSRQPATKPDPSQNGHPVQQHPHQGPDMQQPYHQIDYRYTTRPPPPHRRLQQPTQHQQTQPETQHHVYQAAPPSHSVDYVTHMETRTTVIRTTTIQPDIPMRDYYIQSQLGPPETATSDPSVRVQKYLTDALHHPPEWPAERYEYQATTAAYNNTAYIHETYRPQKPVQHPHQRVNRPHPHRQPPHNPHQPPHNPHQPPHRSAAPYTHAIRPPQPPKAASTHHDPSRNHHPVDTHQATESSHYHNAPPEHHGAPPRNPHVPAALPYQPLPPSHPMPPAGSATNERPPHGIGPPPHEMRPPSHDMRPPPHDMGSPAHDIGPPPHQIGHPPQHAGQPPQHSAVGPPHQMLPPFPPNPRQPQAPGHPHQMPPPLPPNPMPPGHPHLHLPPPTLGPPLHAGLPPTLKHELPPSGLFGSHGKQSYSDSIVTPSMLEYGVTHPDGSITDEVYSLVASRVQRLVSFSTDIFKTMVAYILFDRNVKTLAVRSKRIRDVCYAGILDDDLIESYKEVVNKTRHVDYPHIDGNSKVFYYKEEEQILFSDALREAGHYVAGSCGKEAFIFRISRVRNPGTKIGSKTVPGDACPFGAPLRHNFYSVSRCTNGTCPGSYTCNVYYDVCCPEMPATTNCFSFSIGQLCVTFMPGRKLID